MDNASSPYLQESSNTIILLKLRIDEHDGKISYLYDHFIPDTSLGPQFYWDASKFLHVYDVSGGIGGPTVAVTGDDKRWQYIQRHGFVNNLETEILYDGEGKLFTISVIDTSWNYMQDGSVYQIIDSKTIAIPDVDNTAGTYHIFIDNSLGDLSTTFDQLNLIDSKVHVATVVWDDTLTPSFQLSDERHTALIDKRIHYHLHNTVGATYIAGGDVSSFVIGSSDNIKNPDLVFPISLEYDTSAAWNRISISETTIVDEDLIITLPALEKPSDTSLAYTLFSRTDVSTWKWELVSYPYPFVTDGYITWDERGVPREPSVNYFVNSYILYTNIDGSSRYAVLPGQGQYETLKDARTETPLKFSWDGFPIEEYVIGWQLTWESSVNLPTIPGMCTLAIEPKQMNLNPRTALFDSFKIYHNSTGGLQGGNDPDEYYHVTKLEKKAIAIITPIIEDIKKAIEGEQWVPTDVSSCIKDGGFNTGMRTTTWKQQINTPPSKDWVDSGKKEERLTQNTTACPLTPYRAAIYIGQAYDPAAARSHEFGFSFGTEVAMRTYSVAVPDQNFIFFSIPAGHGFEVRDGNNNDITSKYGYPPGTGPVGTDNVVGFRDNSVWKKNITYGSKYTAPIKITIK